MKEKYPDKYHKYSYTKDLVGLYCKYENEEMPEILTFIHKSGRYYLLKSNNTFSISKTKNNSQITLTKSTKNTEHIKKPDDATLWNHNHTNYLMKFVEYKDDLKDEVCKDIINNKQNTERGVHKTDREDRSEKRKQDSELKLQEENENKNNHDKANSVGNGNKRVNSTFALYVGFTVSAVFIILGFITCYIIMKYPNSTFTVSLSNLIKE